MCAPRDTAEPTHLDFAITTTLPPAQYYTMFPTRETAVPKRAPFWALIQFIAPAAAILTPCSGCLAFDLQLYPLVALAMVPVYNLPNASSLAWGRIEMPRRQKRSAKPIQTSITNQKPDDCTYFGVPF